MSIQDGKITINGKELELSPLRLKHLKAITAAEAQSKPTGVVQAFDRWAPFLIYSIQVKNPDFKPEDLDEATLQEIQQAADVLLSVSGVEIKKVGETKPAVSTGDAYTAG